MGNTSVKRAHFALNHFGIHSNRRLDNLGDRLIMRNMAATLARFGKVRAYDPELFLSPPEKYEPLRHSSTTRRLLARLCHKTHYTVDPAGGFGRVTPLSTGKPTLQRAEAVSLAFRMRRWLSPRKIALGISVQIEPEDSRFDEHCWVGVRDHDSLASLRARGLTQAGYFPDWAFFDPLFNAVPHPRRGAALSFRAQTPDHGHALSGEELHSLVERISTYFGQPTFFHQVDEDRSFSARLHSKHPRSHLEPDALSATTYPSFYRQHRVVASNRLHCLLFGAMNGALPIAVTHSAHTKITSLYRTLGWDSLLVFIDSGQGEEKLAFIRDSFSSLAQLVATTAKDQRDLGERLLSSRLGRACKCA